MVSPSDVSAVLVRVNGADRCRSSRNGDVRSLTGTGRHLRGAGRGRCARGGVGGGSGRLKLHRNKATMGKQAPVLAFDGPHSRFRGETGRNELVDGPRLRALYLRDVRAVFPQERDVT